MSKEYKTASQVIMDLHKSCGGFHSVERAQAAPDRTGISGAHVQRGGCVMAEFGT